MVRDRDSNGADGLGLLGGESHPTKPATVPLQGADGFAALLTYVGLLTLVGAFGWAALAALEGFGADFPGRVALAILLGVAALAFFVVAHRFKRR